MTGSDGQAVSQGRPLNSGSRSFHKSPFSLWAQWNGWEPEAPWPREALPSLTVEGEGLITAISVVQG